MAPPFGVDRTYTPQFRFWTLHKYVPKVPAHLAAHVSSVSPDISIGEQNMMERVKGVNGLI